MASECFLVGCFLGYDIVLAAIFALVTLALSIFALRVSAITSERSVKLFGFGFLLISLSYFAKAFFNFLVLPGLGSSVPTMMKLSFVLSLVYLGAYAHMILMLAGLIVLAYMTFNVKDARILAILLLLGFLPVIISDNPFAVFYLLASLCTLFIVYYYVKNYFKKRQLLSLMTAVAFILLFLGCIHFFASSMNPLFYVLANMLELGAYVLIFINFCLVLRK